MDVQLPTEDPKLPQRWLGFGMRVGVVPAGNPAAGGMYQYSLTLLEQLDRLVSEDARLHAVLLLSGERMSGIVEWEEHFLEPPSPKGYIRRVLQRLVPPGEFRDFVSTFRSEKWSPDPPDELVCRPSLRAWLESLRLDRLIFAAPDPRSFEIGLPYAMPVHDLQHRLQPHFPEVSARGEWERREYVYRNAARTARALLVDSEVGKEDLLHLYSDFGIEEERIFVLPFLAPRSVSLAVGPVRDLLARLPDSFLFYPAQFWPHKNHLRLIEAIGQLKSDGLEVALVLTGSTSGSLRQKTFREVKDRAKELGIDKQIRWLGYVRDYELTALYKHAVALVFPTFFGPTNIPIIEAWHAGCPVVTSDIRGVREQVGDAAVLVSPESVDSIADGLQRVVTREKLREILIEKGSEKAKSYTAETYRVRLNDALSALIGPNS